MIKVLTDENVALISKHYVGNVGPAEGLTQIRNAFPSTFLLGLGDEIPLDFFEAFDFSSFHMTSYCSFINSK
jgi:hypothetical protein